MRLLGEVVAVALWTDGSGRVAAVFTAQELWSVVRVAIVANRKRHNRNHRQSRVMKIS